ncbi:hypothetical protein GTNG_1219 [Geobacillus thermodenitrificans NG80-2]|uniref:Uncharacterized protein n=1 Tax=Geobacillus thermodenitrificans (strain NG80-2) TaxID=420246 RepID=A4IMN7_GEOTN|nr:hypothetical protein GTNG_1219 [Geobacillus thermodenitrificans NG80-2]
MATGGPDDEDSCFLSARHLFLGQTEPPTDTSLSFFYSMPCLMRSDVISLQRANLCCILSISSPITDSSSCKNVHFGVSGVSFVCILTVPDRRRFDNMLLVLRYLDDGICPFFCGHSLFFFRTQWKTLLANTVSFA